jgi:hypothetical protein
MSHVYIIVVPRVGILLGGVLFPKCWCYLPALLVNHKEVLTTLLGFFLDWQSLHHFC